MKPVIAMSLSIALALSPMAAAASELCSTDAMIVFDGSGSMAETGFNDLQVPRIVEAREAVAKAMPHIAPFRRVGLIIYGPRTTRAMTLGGSCSNIELRFAPMPEAGGQVVADIEAMQPAGETPLTAAVAEAAEVLEFRDKPGMIVLVTDGKETCGGSPCHLAGELAAEARDLTVHVIGFRVRSDLFALDDKGAKTVTVAECLAAANGGRYVPAESVDELASALEETLGCRMISQGPQPASPARRLR